jgi:phosphoribosylformylglycinamidine cyclo-ligase
VKPFGISRYAEAGVDIDAKMRAIRGARAAIRSTFTDGVLGDVGGFGGLFRPDLSGCEEPVLVASTDGVGTKVKVAIMAGRHDACGADLVNHCVNDILVQGAKPLFFLDYIATGRIVPEVIESVIEGLARACRENGTALIGGETAEMPGFYADGEYDVAGTIVGIVDRAKILDGSAIRETDVLIGLPSSGLHTNGYSLARRIFFEEMRLSPQSRLEELGETTLGDALLATHRSYLDVVRPLLDRGLIHGMAHITGGGFFDNIPRVLPEGLAVAIKYGSWPVPPLFEIIAREGRVGLEEMLRVFNMGVGMILFADGARVVEIAKLLSERSERFYVVGHALPGHRTVTVDFESSG